VLVPHGAIGIVDPDCPYFLTCLLKGFDDIAAVHAFCLLLEEGPELVPKGRDSITAHFFSFVSLFCHSAVVPSASGSLLYSLRLAHVRHVLAERGGQVDLMVLLFDQNLTDLLCQREFTKALALPDSVTILPDGFVFIFEIEAQHILCI